MTRLAEQRLWDTARRQASNERWRRTLFHQRIENRVGSGVPDVFWKPRDFTDCWTELKAPVVPAKSTTRLFRDWASLGVDQINWALDYADQGGRWYLIARDSDKQLYMFQNDILNINSYSLADARYIRIADNWLSIFQIITGGYHEA